MPKLLLHHIDVLNEEYISGWCLNRFLPWRPIMLDFFVGEEKIGQILCDQPRKDVKQAGLHHSGRCGFEFKFPSHFDINQVGDFKISCYPQTYHTKQHSDTIYPICGAPGKYCFFCSHSEDRRNQL